MTIAETIMHFHITLVNHAAFDPMQTSARIAHLGLQLCWLFHGSGSVSLGSSPGIPALL